MRSLTAVLICLLLPPGVLADDYEQLVLSWNAPKHFTNGERLSVSKGDLKEYRVYYGNSRENIRQHRFSVPAGLSSIRLDRLKKEFVRANPVIYIALSSVSRAEVESTLSEIVFFLP